MRKMKIRILAALLIPLIIVCGYTIIYFVATGSMSFFISSLIAKG